MQFLIQQLGAGIHAIQIDFLGVPLPDCKHLETKSKPTSFGSLTVGLSRKNLLIAKAGSSVPRKAPYSRPAHQQKTLPTRTEQLSHDCSRLPATESLDARKHSIG